MDNKTVITKETKNKIRVDYEGKLSFKERMTKKLKASNTWIKAGVNVMRFILMLGVSFVIIYPFITKIAGSFMTKEDVVDSTVSLIPKHFTLEIYQAIIVDNHYVEALVNTIFLSIACALIQTLISCLVGYGLAKFKFKGNSLIMLLVVITMIIPHRTLQLSMYHHFIRFDFFKLFALENQGLIQLITGSPLKLENTFWPYIILSVFGLAFKNGLYIYMMRQFFKGVPDELEESAYVDGSGVFRTFFQIILPLAVPMMITIFLFSFSWQWTDGFYTTIFFTDMKNKLYLMPDVINVTELMKNLSVADEIKDVYTNAVSNTCGLMVILPLIIIYLFCQRYLIQGIERSGIVG